MIVFLTQPALVQQDFSYPTDLAALEREFRPDYSLASGLAALLAAWWGSEPID